MNLTFFIITIFLMISNLVWMIFFTPMVPDQEWAQKIFYLHVPIAWSGFLAYFFVMVSGICFLYTKNLKFDRIGLASAEIGTIFTALVLIKNIIKIIYMLINFKAISYRFNFSYLLLRTYLQLLQMF